MLMINMVKGFIVIRLKWLYYLVSGLDKFFTKKVFSGGMSTSELVNLIYDFCEIYSGIKMYPYQEQFSKRIIRSVLENDGAEITALFSRQSGKSETIATTVGGMMIILPRLANMPMFVTDKRLEMFKDGLWVGIFAPSQRQAQITYGRMKSRLQCKNAVTVLEDPDFRLQFSTSNGQTVALTNGSFATAISASEGSSIEGESFKFIICEEAQDISNMKIRKSIHPMGSAYNATITKIGTASTFKGDFYEAIDRNKKDYERGYSKRKNHFEYDYRVVMKYNPKYEKYVMKERYRLGEDSDEFQMSYCLKWILKRGMFVDFDQLIQKNGEPNTGRVMTDLKRVHTVGIDLAGGGSDKTVVTPIEVDWENPVISEENVDEFGQVESFQAYETLIKDWLEIYGDDYDEQYYEIMDYLNKFKVGRLTIDATKESSVAHRIRANVDFEVEAFIFSSKSKSELYKHLDGEIKSGRARVPCDEPTKASREFKNFKSEVGDLQKGYNNSYLVVSHPPERGAHDDYADSWALAVWGSRTPLQTHSIQTHNENPFYQEHVSPFVKRRNSITGRRRS